MKKFAVSVVAALLLTAASAGIASAQGASAAKDTGAQASGTSNIWF